MSSVYESMPTVLSVIYALNFIISLALIFVDRKKPAVSVIAWIMVLYLLPGFGILAYFMLSQNITRYKISRRSHFEQAKINEDLGTQMDDMANGRYAFDPPVAEKWMPLITMNQKYGMARFTQENCVDAFFQGKDKFRHLFADISAAKKSINLEYFIIKPDKLGLQLLDLLTRKAREGVQVRLLLDAVGCAGIKKRHIQKLEEAGGQIAYFFPQKYIKINLKLNYRNHRKIVVIDNSVGYIGGYNVALEYIGVSRKFAGWRDTHLRIKGSCVEDLNERFILDWRFASGETIVIPRSEYRDDDGVGKAAVQIVSCGPDSPETEIKLAYLKMITGAEKSVYIQTPYFVPDASIYEAVKSAALSGVDVRIMIPNKPDHPFVYWATYANVGSLLSSGVKVYIYDRGFLHAKTLVVDGEVSSVGSANFDIRSFKLSFETNAIIYSDEFAGKLQSAFRADMSLSRELTKLKYESRSPWIKIKESLGRLTSELL